MIGEVKTYLLFTLFLNITFPSVLDSSGNTIFADPSVEPILKTCSQINLCFQRERSDSLNFCYQRSTSIPSSPQKCDTGRWHPHIKPERNMVEWSQALGGLERHRKRFALHKSISCRSFRVSRPGIGWQALRRSTPCCGTRLIVARGGGARRIGRAGR
jgi:hypothetical protein